MSEVDPNSAGASRMLQRAANGVLDKDAVLKRLMGGDVKILQDAAPNEKTPYITTGEGQDLDDTVQCLPSEENYFDLHVWSDADGWAECKDIAARIKKLLHEADLVLEGNQRCVLIQHSVTRYLRDPNGTSKHAVVTFMARSEEL